MAHALSTDDRAFGLCLASSQSRKGTNDKGWGVMGDRDRRS